MKRKKQADCHPDRFHYALGLCQSCYRGNIAKNSVATCHPNRHAVSGGKCRQCYFAIKGKKATCHPNLAHRARGLCQVCYDKYRWEKNLYKNREDLKWRQKKFRYGLTKEQYELKLLQQEGVCFICKRRPEEDKLLAIDHDHKCCPDYVECGGSCVRALLCSNCNTSIGLLNENPELCLKIATYLKSFQN